MYDSVLPQHHSLVYVILYDLLKSFLCIPSRLLSDLLFLGSDFLQLSFQHFSFSHELIGRYIWLQIWFWKWVVLVLR
jgi:hypothetical protein